MMQQIRLPALIGSHPLGALASFGLLRLISDWDSSVRLGFIMEDDWVARIETDQFSSADSIIEYLERWIGSKVLDQILGWANDVRVPREKYRDVLAHALSADDICFASFLSSVATDGAVDAQKGLVKPSAFYMVSGQQSFLGGMREIVDQIRSSARSSFAEALVGPWSYRTRAHGLGWDPNTERLYALRHRAPTSEKPACIAGAVLLAFWALPLMPVVSKDGRALTIGFTRDRRKQVLSWPIFSTSIDLAELMGLLRAGRSSWMSNDGIRFRRGIESVLESSRFEFGQGYAVLRGARVVPSVESGAASRLRR